MPRKGRNLRRRRPRRNTSSMFIPVSTFCENVNARITATSGGTVDIYPTNAGASSTSDIVVRPTSIDLTCVSGQTAEPAFASTLIVSAIVNNATQLSSRTILMSFGLPVRVRIRVPRSVDYSTATSCYWRLSFSGVGSAAGVANFSIKHVLDAASVTSGQHIVIGGHRGAGTPCSMPSSEDASQFSVV